MYRSSVANNVHHEVYDVPPNCHFHVQVCVRVKCPCPTYIHILIYIQWTELQLISNALGSERMNVQTNRLLVSVSSVLRSTDKSNSPSSLSCTIVDLNCVFTRFSAEKLCSTVQDLIRMAVQDLIRTAVQDLIRMAVQDLIRMAEIMPYTVHNSGNASLR